MIQIDPEHRFKNFALVTQWILRSCAPSLTTIQLSVLLFVADRTYGWGKESEIITYRHFLNGIPSKDPDAEPYAGAVQTSRPSLSAALKHLAGIGLLEVRPGRNLVAYQINLDWNPSQTIENDMPLRSPKRLSEMHSMQTSDRLIVAPTSKVSLPPTSKATLPELVNPLNLKKSKGKNGKFKKLETTSLVASPPIAKEETLDDRIDSAVSRYSVSRQKRLSRWNTDSAEIAWFGGLRRLYPDSPALTVKKFNIYSLRDYGKKWIAAGKDRSVSSWLEYLEWVMSRWSIIRGETFGWMKDAPAVPCIGFFVKLSDKFEAAYEAKESLEAISRMPSRDRQIAKRVRLGMAEDVAAQEVDDRLGLREERERIEAAAAELKRQNIARTNGERESHAASARKEEWAKRRASTQPVKGGTFGEWV